MGKSSQHITLWSDHSFQHLFGTWEQIILLTMWEEDHYKYNMKTEHCKITISIWLWKISLAHLLITFCRTEPTIHVHNLTMPKCLLWYEECRGMGQRSVLLWLMLSVSDVELYFYLYMPLYTFILLATNIHGPVLRNIDDVRSSRLPRLKANHLGLGA